jgi:hypothetical protein
MVLSGAAAPACSGFSKAKALLVSAGYHTAAAIVLTVMDAPQAVFGWISSALVEPLTSLTGLWPVAYPNATVSFLSKSTVEKREPMVPDRQKSVAFLCPGRPRTLMSSAVEEVATRA